VGPNPTDRAKHGVKRSLLVEKDGGPLAITIAGANVPDAKLLTQTIAAVVLERPEPEPAYPQHLCLDKAYDNDDGYGACVDFDYLPHIALIRDPRPERPTRHPARRWVVERTLAWLSKCRGILIRWEKKAEHYLGMLKLACALLWFRRYHRLTAT
jgi:putative transposase